MTELLLLSEISSSIDLMLHPAQTVFSDCGGAHRRRRRLLRMAGRMCTWWRQMPVPSHPLARPPPWSPSPTLSPVRPPKFILTPKRHPWLWLNHTLSAPICPASPMAPRNNGSVTFCGGQAPGAKNLCTHNSCSSQVCSSPLNL